MKRITLLLTILVLLYPLTSITAQEGIAGTAGVVGGARANARTCPHLDCRIVQTLNPGQAITILETVEGASVSNSARWYRIQVNGQDAFVHSSLVTTGQPASAPPPTSSTAFDIYTDFDSLSNHFIPSGWMGDIGDLSVDPASTDQPYSGTTSIRIVYTMQGNQSSCTPAPCKWAGIYWQSPEGNWGTVPNAGYDLRAYNRLTFWARSETPVTIEFKVGGISGTHGDSLQPARSMDFVTLTPQWQQYTIDLTGADLSYIIGGFVWATNWDQNAAHAANGTPLVFYLDDIRFE